MTRWYFGVAILGYVATRIIHGRGEEWQWFAYISLSWALLAIFLELRDQRREPKP
jgi:hypothetical protein